MLWWIAAATLLSCLVQASCYLGARSHYVGCCLILLFAHPAVWIIFRVECGSSLLQKKNSTRFGQLRKSTGEFSRSAQGTPKLTIKKQLRPARFRSTSRSVLLSDEYVFTHGFINTTLSTATFIFQYKQQGFAIT